MHDVHVRSLDLNLLRALDALLAEHSVTRAAARVGLSQSAMSHALGRLRAHLGDPLLVRTANGMQPTTRARALAAPLRATLAQLETLLRDEPAFEPATAHRTFALGVSDFEALTVIQPLLARLRRDAPNVDLRLSWPAPGRVPELLGSGELDMVLKPLDERDAAECMVHQRLFRERFVVVARRDNPLVAKRLTLKRYAEAPHALVAPGGTPRGRVDDVLAEHGLTRRIVVTLPHFLVVPHLIAGSDLLVTLPERVAQVLAPRLDLVLRPLPLSLGEFGVDALWHARSHLDPAHRYLRGLLREVTSRDSRDAELTMGESRQRVPRHPASRRPYS